MAYYDTLQYVDASNETQEVALKLPNLGGAHGAVKTEFVPRSHAAGTFTITWATPPENGIAIPFKSRCKVFAGRSSADGSPNSFSGGTILFQGRRTDNNRGSASGSRVSSSITLSDFFWDLSKATLQAGWQVISGGTFADPTYTLTFWPACVLFQATPGTVYSPGADYGVYINTWQAMVEILQFTQDYADGADGIDFQIANLVSAQSGSGPIYAAVYTPEFTPVYLNWYPLNCPKCLEALQVCLRPHPGVFTGVDYTTVPPTLHFRNVAHMTAVTLPYKQTDDAGITHLATDIESLDDLVPDAVRIFYKETSTFNGQPVINLLKDIYPADAPNSLLCFDYNVDVTGPTQQEVIKNFTSTAFDPTNLDLWRYKTPGLKQVSQGGQIPNDGSAGALTLVDTSPYDSGTHPYGVQVLDETGAPIDLTNYPYYTDEDVYAWFNLGSGDTAAIVKATVKAYFKYSRTTTLGGNAITDSHAQHEHSIRLVLTNAPTGTYVYKQTVNTGEIIPYGLSEAVYNELSVLQWKLAHDIIQRGATPDAVPTLIQPGLNCINLAGGETAWETMNAVPQNVTVEFFRDGAGLLVAKQKIETGPVEHLNPRDIVQLENLFTNRRKSGIDPNQRLTGNLSSNQTNLTLAAAAKENSSDAEPVPITTNNVFVSAGTVAGQTIQDAAGVAAVLAAAGAVPVVSAADAATMKPRLMAACDSVGNSFYIVAQVTGGFNPV